MLLCRRMGRLCLIRHGQSLWNLQNRFTGWTDVALTKQRKHDAHLAGKAMRDWHFDVAFTSVLKRAIGTLTIVLNELGQPDLETIHDKALNERDYGDLNGLNKSETIAKYGEEQVRLWRRSYSTRPPGGESIEDCEKRALPFFKSFILPYLDGGKTVIVSAHGNSMRPMMKYLENLPADEAAVREIAFCTPYLYYFEGEKVVKKEIRPVEGITKQTKVTSLT